MYNICDKVTDSGTLIRLDDNDLILDFVGLNDSKNPYHI